MVKKIVRILDACILHASVFLAVSAWTLAAFLYLREGF